MFISRFKGEFMYYFPDLDEETRLNMISELELDIRNGSFYEPLSMSAYGLSCYKSVLKSCFENGDADTLSRQLTKNFLRVVIKAVVVFRLT